jgi:hypothetical protein
MARYRVQQNRSGWLVLDGNTPVNFFSAVDPDQGHASATRWNVAYQRAQDEVDWLNAQEAPARDR